MAQPPFTLGMDVCGTVDAAPEGFEQWIGRRVCAITAMSLGGMADYALASIASVFDAPEPLNDVQAAAFTLPFHTGYLALHERARLQVGETVLVTAGASAVGTALIQLAAVRGARVLAIAGDDAKRQQCLDLGASVTVSRTDDVFVDVMAATDGRGADVVCDLVGGDATEPMWTCVANGGRYVPIGFNDDAQSGLTGRPLRKVSMGNFSVVGVMLSYGPVPEAFRRFGVNPFPAETGQRVHRELCALIERGVVRPVIGRVISMSEVGAALEDHEQRRTSGRTVVDLTKEI
jgi:NADPH2:quinone reductase